VVVPLCIGFLLVEAVLDTSADKPSTVVVLGDEFDQEGVEVADALVVVRAREVRESNLPLGGEVVARWELVAAAVDLDVLDVDVDVDDVTRLCLLPRNLGEVFSASSQLPLLLLQLVKVKVPRSCVPQVSRWLVQAISVCAALSRMDEAYFVLVEEEWMQLDRARCDLCTVVRFDRKNMDAVMRAPAVDPSQCCIQSWHVDDKGPEKGRQSKNLPLSSNLA